MAGADLRPGREKNVPGFGIGTKRLAWEAQRGAGWLYTFGRGPDLPRAPPVSAVARAPGLELIAAAGGRLRPRRSPPTGGFDLALSPGQAARGPRPNRSGSEGLFERAAVELDDDAAGGDEVGAVDLADAPDRPIKNI
jgi:hypothetical protein